MFSPRPQASTPTQGKVDREERCLTRGRPPPAHPSRRSRFNSAHCRRVVEGPPRDERHVVPHRADVAHATVEHLPRELDGPLGVPRLDRDRTLGEHRLEVVRLPDLAADLLAQHLREDRGDLGAAGDLRAQPVVLAAVPRRAIPQHRRRHGGDVPHGDPADPAIAPEDGEGPVPYGHHVGEQLHEHVRVKVGPGRPAALDVALDQLVPGEVRVGAVPVPEDALVDDVPHPGLGRRIDDRLALHEHGDRVAGQQEQPVHPGEGLAERAGVVQVQEHGVPPFGFHPLDLLGPAGGEADLDASWIMIQLCDDQPSGLPGRTEHEDGRFPVVNAHRRVLHRFPRDKSNVERFGTGQGFRLIRDRSLGSQGYAIP